MSEIEKMKRYIERTGVLYKNSTPYQMNIGELFALSHMSENDVTGAIYLAFDYGRAKGERSAKAKMKEAIS